MSTLRVDNIKGRTGTTVNIPDSNNLSVSGSLNVTGVTHFLLEQNLIFRELILTLELEVMFLLMIIRKDCKISLGTAGQVLKSDGTDVVFGDPCGATNVYYVSKNGSDAAGRGGSIDAAWASLKYACSKFTNNTNKNKPAVIFVKSGTYEETRTPNHCS